MGRGAAQDNRGAAQVRTEILYRDGIVVLVSDIQEKIRTLHRAKGHVQMVFQDIVITGDEAEYDEETKEGFISGKVHFAQNQQWLSCSLAEFNFATQTGAFHNASGYTDREFLISGKTILKTGKDTYRIEQGTATACQDKVPKWSFHASRTDIRINRTARMHGTVFKIKGIPVLYTPYLILPIGTQKRSSGFVPFHTGTSTTKGRVFSQGYYQTLGKSADLLVYGDYFTLRGLAAGGIFRARPHQDTRLELQLYGIDDKLDQGGLQLAVDAESRLKEDWRAVVHANIFSNFAFRQAFAESLQSATIPVEKALGFLTRNHKSLATNIAFGRDVILFPDRSLVIKKIPSLEFASLGTPLGRSPFILNFRAALDGVSRSDSLMETRDMIQRLDVYPRLTVQLPSLGGFSILPSAGVRDTYYGARASEDAPSGIANRGFHRRYADLNIEMRTPVLERSFASSAFGHMRHAVEPYVTYRRIHGIDDLDTTIRFDAEDAIADTNEIEYGVVNRFFREMTGEGSGRQQHEFMSFSLIQKYYFDPTFGGAFKEGRINAFYPLDSVTGLYQTGTATHFAPLSAVFRFSPRKNISNDIRADYDTRLQRWRNTSISTLWEQGKFFVSGTYFVVHPVEEGFYSGEHLQGQIRYGSPARGISSSLTASYNLKTGQWLNSNTRISYAWDCCSLGADFNQYDLGLRTESRFSFSFTLKGIGHFGNMRGTQSPY